MVKIHAKHHLLEVEIWVSVDRKITFAFSSIMLWFHKMSCICKQFMVYHLFKKLEKWHHGLLETQFHCWTLCNEVVLGQLTVFLYHDLNKIPFFKLTITWVYCLYDRWWYTRTILFPITTKAALDRHCKKPLRNGFWNS